MVVVRTHTSVFGGLFFALAAATMTPTHLSASVITTRRVAILGSFAAVFLICSENARTITKKAFCKAEIVAYQLAQHLPLSDSFKQKISDKLTEKEALYITRSGNHLTGENLKAFLKEFKELWDITKAGKEMYTWLAEDSKK